MWTRDVLPIRFTSGTENKPYSDLYTIHHIIITFKSFCQKQNNTGTIILPYEVHLIGCVQLLEYTSARIRGLMFSSGPIPDRFRVCSFPEQDRQHGARRRRTTAADSSGSKRCSGDRPGTSACRSSFRLMMGAAFPRVIMGQGTLISKRINQTRTRYFFFW